MISFMMISQVDLARGTHLRSLFNGQHLKAVGSVKENVTGEKEEKLSVGANTFGSF